MSAHADPYDRPRRHPDSAFKSIAGEGGLVILPGKSEIKVLNPVALEIYSLLDGQRTVEEIARAISDDYEVSIEDATRDVREFVRVLDQHGMLAEAGSEVPEVSS